MKIISFSMQFSLFGHCLWCKIEASLIKIYRKEKKRLWRYSNAQEVIVKWIKNYITRLGK